MQVEKLAKAYGARTLFSDVSFHIGERDRCALAGRNGSGKSTLLKILAGEEEADAGNLYFPKGHRIGSLPQYLKFTELTLLDEAVLGLPEEERYLSYKAEIILEGLGFTDADFAKPPESFSGGYQLRLALCKVLVGEPDLLILDEPTNYLDILAIRWLESFLTSWRGQILFVSHDRSFVNQIATHVIGIKRGQVKKVAGDLDAYQQMIEIHEETYEKQREGLEKKKKHMMSFVERFGSKATKASQAQSRLKAIEKMGLMDALQEEQDLAFSFNYKRIQSKRILHAKKIDFAYLQSVPLIRQVNFEIENGEKLAIIGKNGSGKSTLVRLLLGELTPNSGEVTYGPNTEMAYFGQTNIDRLNPAHTIEEELAATFPEVPYGRLCQVCGVMLFSGDDIKKKISVLSGGERSRVLLAKILLTPANLLLLDEPTHHLDVESVDALMQAIARFPGSVVLVSHDESVLARLHSDKLIICHQEKQELFLGTYPLFLETKGWEEEL
ncbi:MAG: ABC-F family ATP-binding cassette domain-containing protein [Chlamydiia bacterium]|nr:ABC-F family ATP-binding cassette domain-containing protein [Chlamydiia bacterium]